MRNIVCKICGKEFSSNKTGLVFTCSKVCSLKNQKAESLEWGYKHRPRLAELARKYRKNPILNEKIKERARKRYYVYKQTNPEILKEWNNRATKKYASKPLVKLVRRLWAHNRRLDKKTFMNIELWLDLVEKLDYKCQGCLKKFPLEKLEIDHIMPISKGGTGIIENLQPLCRNCNARKGAKTPKRIYKFGQRVPYETVKEI